MGRKISQDTMLKRFRVQAEELNALRNNSIVGGGMNAVYTDYVTCQGTQPSRLSGEGHKKCGKKVRIQAAYKCLYCGFWFCATCAEVHFGKTREQHNKEMREKDDETQS